MKNRNDKDYTERLRQLIDRGVALSSEKEINRLMEQILYQAAEMTSAFSACFYLTRENATYEKRNVVSLQRKSVLCYLKSFHRDQGLFDRDGVLNIDNTSVAGHVASSKEIINISNCQKIAKESSYKFNEKFHKESHEAKSLLTIPVITAAGKVRGVIQLVNKVSEKGLAKMETTGEVPKKNIITFTKTDEELMRIFASYSAIALENAQLTESIENLFESFVRASVKAIEARDPTTSGHSDRVAMMTVELALATHKIGEGPFKRVQFSEDQIKEIRYASLLHDFGKIGVTEPVLLKKKKLKDRELESILLRFDTMAFNNETLIWKNLCDKLIVQQERESERFDADVAYQNALKQIEMVKMRLKKMRSNVITANEPQVMSDDFDIVELVEKISQANEFFDNSVLTQAELNTLSIPRGSLTPIEREEIESHVSHTYNFLKQIAWTENLSHVTTIAHGHHEKIDGSGYPRGIQGDEIPIQSRMMTIADIYDALTAFDRPYKKSLPPAKALEILIKEARSNKIDGYLLKIFIEAGVFHHATLGTHKKAS
ncbi:MAG: HD domain-containing phosphohydrolase [Pseudomonadota bacterium]